MIRVQQELLQALGDALAELAPEQPPVPAFESPKQAGHGDLAITAAMQLAKPLKRNPRELAAQLVEALQRRPAVQRWVRALEIAGPGFINLRLADAAKQQVVAEVLAAGVAFGRKPASGERVMVEFVSANPTGPLHVGHGRNAALGDSIAHLLETQGHTVTREFYYNDAGVQIATLATSTQARIKGLKPGDAAWPENAYNGDYIADIAAAFLAKQAVHADDREFTASGDPEDLDSIRQFAVAWLRHEQDLDLRAFDVRFDHYFLESGLYTDGRVEDTVARLVAAGKTYEDGGALWLRSTEYGDDKDRVMRKSDGTYTYFVPDVAYHLTKFRRGFGAAVNIQGSDHHSTVTRVRAGLQALGLDIPPGYPDYVLHKMVKVVRAGEPVKMSKRAGDYVTVRELIDEVGRDAVRYFFLMRTVDSELVFDIDLAKSRSEENPVYYVQYAHARVCSVLREWGGEAAALAGADMGLLSSPYEVALAQSLAEFPELLERAAREFAPHLVTYYLHDAVAARLHTYYNAERFLVDEESLKLARLALVAATRQVLANGLAVLGVSAPERM